MRRSSSRRSGTRDDEGWQGVDVLLQCVPLARRLLPAAPPPLQLIDGFFDQRVEGTLDLRGAELLRGRVHEERRAHIQLARERPDRIRLAEQQLHRPCPPSQPRADGLVVVDPRRSGCPPARTAAIFGCFLPLSAAFCRFLHPISLVRSSVQFSFGEGSSRRT